MNDLFTNNEIRRPKNMLPDVPIPKTIHSMSCGLSARSFFDLVKREKITAVIGTRLTKRYRGFGFATQEDDFCYLCETHGVEYCNGDILAPTDFLRKTFHREFTEPKTTATRNPKAWTEYLVGYETLLQQRKPLQSGLLYDVLYGTTHASIAIVCSCLHHDDCHRSYPCGVISRYIDNITLSILYPADRPPSRKSPRRYRNQDFVHADLYKNSPKARR